MSYFAKATLCARVLTTILAAVSLNVMGNAQVNGPELRVVVPFSFESGSHQFRAGTYYVQMEDSRLTLEGANDRLVTIAVRDESLDAARRSTVVFRRYGDRYFLREVWLAGRRSHMYCIPTQAEKQVQVAMAKQHATGVAVALLDSPK